MTIYNYEDGLTYWLGPYKNGKANGLGIEFKPNGKINVVKIRENKESMRKVIEFD